MASQNQSIKGKYDELTKRIRDTETSDADEKADKEDQATIQREGQAARDRIQKRPTPDDLDPVRVMMRMMRDGLDFLKARQANSTIHGIAKKILTQIGRAARNKLYTGGRAVKSTLLDYSTIRNAIERMAGEDKSNISLGNDGCVTTHINGFKDDDNGKAAQAEFQGLVSEYVQNMGFSVRPGPNGTLKIMDPNNANPITPQAFNQLFGNNRQTFKDFLMLAAKNAPPPNPSSNNNPPSP